MSDDLRAYFADPSPEPDWSDREAVIEYLVEDERVCVAPLRPFEEAERRELAGRIFDRTTDIAASAKSHWVLDGGESRRERLGDIRVPKLVLHGTEEADALRRERRRIRLLIGNSHAE